MFTILKNSDIKPMMRSYDEDRARGALLGLAVGDALGTTLEFSRPNVPPFPAKMKGPHSTITGAGPFRLAKGQVTDDTQMAAALAISLAQARGYKPDKVQKLYQLWSTRAFDIGGQTSGSLRESMRDTSISLVENPYAGYRYWKTTGRRAAGNGSLMRTAPLGVYYAQEPEGRTMATLQDSFLTHADPRCLLACVSFNWAVARGVNGGSRSAMFQAAAQGLDAGVFPLHPERSDYFSLQELNAAVEALEEDLEAAQQPDPGLLTGDVSIHGSAGFVRTAYRYAFWALHHAETFEEALIDVVNRGGDADTNGAIAGALLGAFFGSKDIPAGWRHDVLTALEGEDSNPWWNLFHPRFLLCILNEQPLPEITLTPNRKEIE